MEKTLAIIKPDGVARGLIGEVIKRIEKEHLNILDIKMVHLNDPQAQVFYGAHMDKPFFTDLIEFTCSGPIVVMILEGLGAIQRWRALMGVADSSEALPGTIRRDFGDREVIRYNVVHGSDGPEAAKHEINYFFYKENCYV